MLLTAVTDYGSGPERPVLSALLNQTNQIAALANSERKAPEPTETSAANPIRLESLKPQVPEYFTPANREPTAARRSGEQEKAGRGALPPHRRLKWDENGWHREEVALVTAYCPCSKCCGSFASGTTSIGKNAWLPGLAADPAYLEYGTKVYVPGYGLALIDDTGGAMRRHWRRNGLLHIDVRMTFHYEARQWGSQYIRVKIYDN